MEQQPLFSLDEYTVETPEDERQSMLAHYLGDEAAEIVVQEAGGWNLRVPVESRGAEYERLSAKLGEEITEKIIQAFGGELLYIPVNLQARIIVRNKKIKAKFEQLVNQGGMRTHVIQKIAKEHKLTERHIRRILG